MKIDSPNFYKPTTRLAEDKTELPICYKPPTRITVVKTASPKLYMYSLPHALRKSNLPLKVIQAPYPDIIFARQLTPKGYATAFYHSLQANSVLHF